MIPVVCPWTGGADTTYLVLNLVMNGYDVHTYHVDYGNMNHPAEMWAIDKIYDDYLKWEEPLGKLHKPVEMMYYIPNVKSMWYDGVTSNIHEKKLPYGTDNIKQVSRSSFDIPFRNGILFTMGVSFAESLNIPTLMLQVEDETTNGEGCEYRDDSMDFVRAVDNLCKVSSFVRIETPISDVDVVKRYLFAYALNIHPFVNVGRCNFPRLVDGEYKPCGKCITCESSKYMLREFVGTEEFWGVCWHEDQPYYK